MTKRMRASITAMLNEVDENLMAMAQRSDGTMNESDCYAAVREIRLKRVEIKTRFERRFINLFESQLQGLQQGQELLQDDKRIGHANREELRPLSFASTLGLVKEDCGRLLLELDKKIALLMDQPQLMSPMQPEIVFEAFREACRDIKSGDEVREMMFGIFERRIAEELQGIYEDLNKLLDSQGAGEKNLTAPAERWSRIQGDEEILLLRYEVTNRIESRLAGHQVPEFVHAFLLKHWRLFLENIYSNYSENSIAWNAARQTMDDLIWAVSKPRGLYDRQRQVQMLPSLLFRLLNGMKVIAMDDKHIEQFLKDLKQHQLKSLELDDGELLDDITDTALKSVSHDHSKLPH